MFKAACLSLLLASFATLCQAQTANFAESEQLLAMRAEVVDWLKLYKKYDDFRQKYGARTHFDNGATIRVRPVRPTPPVWLKQVCADLISTDDEVLVQACGYLQQEYDRLHPLEHQYRHQAVQLERRQKTTLLNQIHFDGFYSSTTIDNYGLGGMYGLVGLHWAFKLPGYERVEIYGPPGITLLRAPGYGIGLRTAFTWGFDIKVASVKRVDLYLNLVKCWVNFQIGLNAVSGQDMAGISFKFR